MSSKRDLLKRIYREIVAGRSKVKIVSADKPSLDIAPIFLVGVFRSGTTLLRYIIDSHPNICCPPESNFLLSLNQMTNNEVELGGLNSLGFDDEHVIDRMRQFSSYFFENYMKTKEKVRWADKSPRYVDCLDFIERLYPNAQFVIIHRHGLDVANSFYENGWNLEKRLAGRLEEFHEDLRLRALQYWIEQTAKITKFQQEHPDKCHTIIYEQLCSSPEEILKKVFEFLTEEFPQQILNFASFDHDVGQEDSKIIGSDTFSVSKNNYRKWPKEIIEEGMMLARATLKDLGYSVDQPTA